MNLREALHAALLDRVRQAMPGETADLWGQERVLMLIEQARYSLPGVGVADYNGQAWQVIADITGVLRVDLPLEKADDLLPPVFIAGLLVDPIRVLPAGDIGATSHRLEARLIETRDASQSGLAAHSLRFDLSGELLIRTEPGEAIQSILGSWPPKIGAANIEHYTPLTGASDA